MERRTLRRTLLIIVLLIATTLAALVLRRQALDQQALEANYTDASTDLQLSHPVHLADVSVIQQMHPYSCAPATISMVVSHLVSPLTEEDYASRSGLSARKKGMLPRVFRKYLQSALPNRTVELVTDESPLDVLRLLHTQLSAGVPVPVYFSTVNAWQPNTTDTHYSAVTGMDLSRGVIHIANVYGFEEDVSVAEFLERLAFRNHSTENLGHRLARWTGFIAKNNVYLISPADSPRDSRDAETPP